MKERWKKFQEWLPRPSLLWMSRADVLHVRNQLAGLCYPRGSYLLVGDIFVYPALLPKFEFCSTPAIEIRAWLKVRKGVAEWDVESRPGEIATAPFNDPKARRFAQLVKKMSKEFNYHPTQTR